MEPFIITKRTKIFTCKAYDIERAIYVFIKENKGAKILSINQNMTPTDAIIITIFYELANDEFNDILS